MKTRLIAAAAGVLVGLLIAWAAAPAQAAPYVPTATSLLNVPKAAGGTTAQQSVYDRTLAKSLDAMNPGAVARLAYYDINIPDAAAAIKRTAARGVNVRLILNGNSINAIEADLLRALGSNVAAGRSWGVACQQSCNSSRGSAMHSKFATLSSTGNYASRYVVFVGSANLTTTNAGLNWNQSNLILDKGIYTGFAKFFDGMRYDRDGANVYREFAGTNSAYRGYAWPSGTLGGANPILSGLKAVNCKTSGAYGSGGRTEIKVNMFFWTAARYAEADLLAAKARAGCKVTVLYIRKDGTRSVDQTILNRLWAGGVTMYNSRSAAGDLYTHGKSMIIDGTVYGRPNKVVWNGSNNLTGNYTQTNEAMLRIDSNGVTAVYETNFALMVKHSRRDTVRPTIVPPTSADRRATEEPDFRDLDLL